VERLANGPATGNITDECFRLGWYRRVSAADPNRGGIEEESIRGNRNRAR